MGWHGAQGGQNFVSLVVFDDFVLNSTNPCCCQYLNMALRQNAALLFAVALECVEGPPGLAPLHLRSAAHPMPEETRCLKS